MDGAAPTILSGGACCPTPAIAVDTAARVDASFVHALGDGAAHVDFLVPEIHCAACLTSIEGKLMRLPGVSRSRANLTSRRVGVTFDPAKIDPDRFVGTIEALGYTARPFDAVQFDAAGRDEVGKELFRSLAVAGFAAGNVMLLSVSVWSGAEAATRDLFHWISALIALPAIAYAGRPFFRSAVKAVAAGGLNMDVPISIGVLLAAGMSLYETATGGPHAYFDAAISLLFFLLVGRALDHRMRDVARSAAARLLSLTARSAMRINPDGTVAHVPLHDVVPGDRLRIAVGDRIPLDGVVVEGQSDIDLSMLTGEPRPQRIAGGERAFAGTLNLTGPLIITATAKAGETLLAEIVRLMESAERSSGRYVRLADRVSRFYAPFVHILALATAIGWLIAGAGWHMALTTAVAVLIITCPCALGLAVPAVQVVASGFLLGRGVMLKDGSALERLAAANIAVFDKTGTLTEGEPRLLEASFVDDRGWSIAAALGQASRHPFARALTRAATLKGAPPATLDEVAERPGDGMEATADGVTVRLGRREWVGGHADGDLSASEIRLRVGEAEPIRFVFEDRIRSDAADVVAALRTAGLETVLLSGDRPNAVAAAARRTGVAEWHGAQRPADKAAFLARLAKEGRRVLMVGDGLNDAPALASAFVSISPSNAADISQTAADIVFTGRKLGAVALALRVARKARRLVTENIALAIGYNLIAVPLAIAGYATPMIAAIAMSTSSIIVTANALRLPLVVGKSREPDAVDPARQPVGATS
jgi:Cu2+-exporting ATPase